jgi:hypothetical protein
MFAHLHIRGDVVQTKSTAGQVALEKLDLNDPDLIARRSFVRTTIAQCEAKRREINSALAEIRKKQKRKKIPVADAKTAIESLLSGLEVIDRNSRYLAGL